jgi:hypothetical protein
VTPDPNSNSPAYCRTRPAPTRQASKQFVLVAREVNPKALPTLRQGTRPLPCENRRRSRRAKRHQTTIPRSSRASLRRRQMQRNTRRLHIRIGLVPRPREVSGKQDRQPHGRAADALGCRRNPVCHLTDQQPRHECGTHQTWRLSQKARDDLSSEREVAIRLFIKR